MNWELSAENWWRSTNENHSLTNMCDDEKKRIPLNCFSGSTCSSSYIMALITGSSPLDLVDAYTS